MRGKIQTLEHRIVYRNKYATVWDDLVRFPSGIEGTYFRWQWNVPFGVAIVPLVADEVVLIKAYRYQEQGFVVEIPQGFGEEGSTPEQDAKRELFEETGLVAESIEPLMNFSGGTKTYVFLAHVNAEGQAHADGMEHSESIIDFVRLPIAEISPQRLQELGVVGPLSASALLAVHQITAQ